MTARTYFGRRLGRSSRLIPPKSVPLLREPGLAPEGPCVPDTLPEAEQLRQLRRELKRVQMERDILKKAVGIFSQMPPRT